MIKIKTGFYYCYSYPLKNFLITNGLRFVIKGIHPETQKRYWIFQRDEQLDKLLGQWQSQKK